MSRDDLLTARAEALAVSSASTATRLDRAAADAAIEDAVRAHAGVNGCAAALASEYGEHPETAVPRMRWALDTVAALYGTD